ncbi:MAG: SUMF1/EgtB/PvdO family nonheme iron enzyme [Phycisphaerales bacterium]
MVCSPSMRRVRLAVVRALFVVTVGALAAAASQGAADTARPASLAPYSEPVKGTTLEIAMVPIVPKDGGKPFYLSKTEVTWDLYDTFVFGFDLPKPVDGAKEGTGEARPGAAPAAKDGAPTGASAPTEAGKEADPRSTGPDGFTRPTKPYILTDRGYGHAGYPAISVSYLGAKQFCEWLSMKTGKKYRLPTVAEWQVACTQSGITPEKLGDVAWFAENSVGKTHAVGSAKPDANGLFDLYGNASEWVTSDEGKGVTIGGTFKDPSDKLGCSAIVPYTPDWNASDPQYPKSKWWLADAGFVGFRILCETPDK